MQNNAGQEKAEEKPLQSIYNLMHGLEQIPKGVMQKEFKGK